MKKYFAYFIFIILFFSCHDKKEDVQRVYHIGEEELVQNNVSEVLTLTIDDIKKGTEVIASVRIKNHNSKGELLIQSKNKDQYFQVVRNSSDSKIDEEGYATIKFRTSILEPLENDQLIFSVANESTDSVFYRDLHVEIYPKEKIPHQNYSNEVLKLNIDALSMDKLKVKIEKAKKKGVLVKGEDDWVNATITIKGEEVPCELRLKGDWLDHINTDKWSFRIKIKGDHAWNRMKEFSVQKPEIRGFLYEWFYHQMLEQEDVLTTRYGFMPVELNGDLLGLYAYEEHFVKQLLEYRKRKEAPILKYDESGFWDKVAYIEHPKKGAINVIEFANVKAFKGNRTNKSSSLRSLFEIGETYLQQLKNDEVTVSEVCDITAFAKYFAITELCQAQHSQMWHNMRFYINPVTGLLEPIAYDGFWGNYKKEIVPLYLWESGLSCSEENTMEFKIPLFMSDSSFVKEYNYYLNKYLEKDFISQFIKNKYDEIEVLKAVIDDEYSDRNFDPNFLISTADSLQTYKNKINSFVSTNCYPKLKYEKREYVECEGILPQENTSLKAFSKSEGVNKKTVYIANYFCRDLEIKGFGNGGKLQYKLDKSIKMNRFDGGNKYVEVIIPANFNEVNFSLIDGDSLFNISISAYSKPKTIEPRKTLKSFKSNLDKYSSVSENNIVFKAGADTVTEPIYIPEGYKVTFEKGCSLNFINSSFFFSESPITIAGTLEDSVIITSLDHTARGFTVQSKERSSLSHCRIDGFNDFELEGWALPGSVNFYEGNIKLENTVIKNNVCEDALNIVRATFSLDKCVFKDTWGDAFDADFSNGMISNTDYINIGNDAMDFSTSRIDITNCSVYNCGDKGLSGGEQSMLTVDNLKVTYANIGIASKDLSIISVDRSEIIACKYGLLLYRKKPEYGPATLNFNNSIIDREAYKNYIQLGSNLFIDGDKQTCFKTIPKGFFK